MIRTMLCAVVSAAFLVVAAAPAQALAPGKKGQWVCTIKAGKLRHWGQLHVIGETGYLIKVRRPMQKFAHTNKQYHPASAVTLC